MQLNFVSFQQHAQLVLKTNLAMMLLLSGNVLLHLLEEKPFRRGGRALAAVLAITSEARAALSD